MKSQTRPQSAKQRLISDKINTLAKYHLQEINEFQEENYTLRDNINQLHASNRSQKSSGVMLNIALTNNTEELV